MGIPKDLAEPETDIKDMKKDTQDQRYQSLKNRYFNLNLTASAYHAALSKYTKAKYAVFMDLVENSMMDLLVVSQPQPGDQFEPVQPIYNNLQSQNFYLKARMISDDTIGAPVRASGFKAVLTSL